MSCSQEGDILKADRNLVGTVVAVQANFYQVKLDTKHDSVKKTTENFTQLLCTRRSRLKKMGQKVMVGDRAIIEDPDWVDGRGVVAEVLPRTTELDRPPVANANQVMLVFAMAEPDLDPVALTRFLVKAESTGLEVCLCLNKCDIVTAEEIEKWRNKISQWGYEPFFISVKTNAGLETVQNGSTSLWEKLKNKITVISGPSGVGKSSLINYLIPNVNLRVAAVSGKLSRGRHTTRHVELFELPNGGLLADTPGFNQPQLECEPLELGYLFPEVRQYLTEGSCQFSDCLHRDEPNCVVRGNWDRYEYYLMFLEDAIAYQEALQQKPDAESNWKAKMKSGGEQKLEPKLASKKYRRSSRRLQHQQLQDLCEEFDEF